MQYVLCIYFITFNNISNIFMSHKEDKIRFLTERHLHLYVHFINPPFLKEKFLFLSINTPNLT